MPLEEYRRKRDFGRTPEPAPSEVVARSGRYGPYVSHDGVNATLPAGMAPDAISLDQVIALLSARAERGGKRAPAKPRRGARKVRATAKAAAMPGRPAAADKKPVRKSRRR